MNNTSSVLLPAWIWEKAQDKAQLKQLVLDYMSRYPDYEVLKIKNRFAICKRN
ncbi:hypothetical protein [Bacillus sp. FSL K6-3431]|uniref:hypothetical protein n=1 Tax=Bacillus sp. FSL K6-3431 TaxID=2921500 RepID=UPI0030FB7245